MCGIAGLIHKGKSSNIGGEVTSMLQALKHRGPDSTGFAIYGEPNAGDYIMRFKVAEAATALDETVLRRAENQFDNNSTAWVPSKWEASDSVKGGATFGKGKGKGAKGIKVTIFVKFICCTCALI